MVRLLDHIFSNIDQVEADRTQIQAYLKYLNEIIGQDLTPEKKDKFLGLRAQLERKLWNLERE